MRRGIHLDHVDMPAFGDRPARLAHAAGIDGRAALPVRPDAVQRLCDQPRGRGLADPANAGEEEGMGKPVALDSIAQCLDHGLLPDQLIEALRPVFSGEYAVRLGGIGHRRQPKQAHPVIPAKWTGAPSPGRGYWAHSTESLFFLPSRTKDWWRPDAVHAWDFCVNTRRNTRALPPSVPAHLPRAQVRASISSVYVLFRFLSTPRSFARGLIGLWPAAE